MFGILKNNRVRLYVFESSGRRPSDFDLKVVKISWRGIESGYVSELVFFLRVANMVAEIYLFKIR